ncbi:hypothetical protein [Candidatus Amarobacter glycogenicus]|uniref:hypothetical protein n=1 Tax=Candidatus Amarobacter glycogenicus TaxID=3140699 RepID=UPI002A17633C|nr:hypothetical protein [Dehalococcoidia bacterium]
MSCCRRSASQKRSRLMEANDAALEEYERALEILQGQRRQRPFGLDREEFLENWAAQLARAGVRFADIAQERGVWEFEQTVKRR